MKKELLSFKDVCELLGKKPEELKSKTLVDIAYEVKRAKGDVQVALRRGGRVHSSSWVVISKEELKKEKPKKKAKEATQTPKPKKKAEKKSETKSKAKSE